MTREEAYQKFREWCNLGFGHSTMPGSEVLVMAMKSLHPITREQVEKMRGKWIDVRYSSKDVPKCQCSICGKKYIGLETDFCQYCGAPMADKAVDILWKRLEAMQDEAETV